MNNNNIVLNPNPKYYTRKNFNAENTEKTLTNNEIKNQQNAEFQEFLDLEKKIISNQDKLQQITISFTNYKQNNENIYEHDTVFNLKDRTTKEYCDFLTFMNDEIKNLYTEFESNKGDIFTYHLFTKLSKTEKVNAETILKEHIQTYKEIYSIQLDTLKQDEFKNAFQNNKREYYPYFKKDMMSKSRKLQFEKVEQQIGIAFFKQNFSYNHVGDTSSVNSDGVFLCKLKPQ